MKFYDLHLKGRNPETDYSIIKEAAYLGYSGVSISYSIDNYKNIKYLDEIKDQINSEVSQTPFQLDPGLELYPKNPEDFKKKVRKFRNKTDLLLVHGGDLKINRAACENVQLDILSRPYYKRRDCGINHVLAKEAAKNNVAVELNISDILKSWLTLRSKLLAHFREIIKLHKKFGFPLIITSGATSFYDIRSPRDLIALAQCFGLNHEESISALSKVPHSIMDYNKHRGDMVIGGVKKVVG
ncbi:ribonuclease P protein component 3 [Methanobacterium alcaliphilum]|uniref:ribonuclease P protein component 3 n=1 Tax=Methanobacterium alcaliphilum TaxID=392018 RepID=UPI00200A993B|nr:RNase P subunit p30 family protein [Methanobacterium alcaliphilum]MCK9152067.1 ribonuclease P [Methanobacterium alcaliphilum]